LGAPSTKSLLSFRPKPVAVRTSLITCRQSTHTRTHTNKTKQEWSTHARSLLLCRWTERHSQLRRPAVRPHAVPCCALCGSLSRCRPRALRCSAANLDLVLGIERIQADSESSLSLHRLGSLGG
jgi:hypothetical protein